jgi:hypothetical protein
MPPSVIFDILNKGFRFPPYALCKDQLEKKYGSLQIPYSHHPLLLDTYLGQIKGNDGLRM